MSEKFSGQFLKRFIIYPAIIGFLTYGLLDGIAYFEIGRLFIDSGPLAILEETFNIPLPFEQVKYYYSYAVGFTYGTISVFLPIRKLRLGIIGLVLMYLQYGISLLMLAPFIMFWIPIELILSTGFYFKGFKIAR